MRPYIQRILKGSKLERGRVVEQIKRTPRTSIWHAHFYNIRRRRRLSYLTKSAFHHITADLHLMPQLSNSLGVCHKAIALVICIFLPYFYGHRVRLLPFSPLPLRSHR